MLSVNSILFWFLIMNEGANITSSGATRKLLSIRNTTDCSFSVNDLLDGTYKIDFNQTLGDIVVEVTEFVCGTSKLCNASVGHNGKVCTHECADCHCDDLCYFYADCCPDMMFLDPSTHVAPSPYVTCVTEYWTTWAKQISVSMVNLCPTTSKISKDIINKCEELDIHDEIQATPVSDVQSRITYRNVYCAICHSVELTIPWTHRVTCESSFSASQVTNNEDLWKTLTKDDLCKFATFPPKGVSVRRCTARVKASCGDRFMVEKDKLETLCRLYTHILGDYSTMRLATSYKNVFCALCNGDYLGGPPLCGRVKPVGTTFPLSVVIDFNPISLSQTTIQTPTSVAGELERCSQHEILDPFSSVCKPLQCHQRRVLRDNQCESKFADIRGLGFSFSAIVKHSNSMINVSWDTFLLTYEHALRKIFAAFSPFVFYPLVMSKYIKLSGHEKTTPILAVQGNVVSKSEKGLDDMEQALREITSLSFTYSERQDNSTAESLHVSCFTTAEDMLSDDYVSRGNRTIQPRNIGFCAPHSIEDCFVNVEFAPFKDTIKCPHLEFNLTESNFTYDSDNHTIITGNHVIPLNQSGYLYCGRVVKLCSDLLNNIREILRQETSDTVPPESSDLSTLEIALTLVSFISISLSLFGLFLTFLVYCVSPQLRTLPGKNNMALIFHLFCAQLIFESGARRTSNPRLCQALGVLIHYFWLASFAWMAVCAYHMCTVFTNLLPVQHNPIGEVKKFLSFCLFSCLCPAFLILTCIIYHLASSNGTGIDYGGVICFLNQPRDIGIFFVAPIGAMVLFNSYCFVRTILAIRNVPDMTNTSTKTNKHHAVVYFRLSVLFGFTWVFGILASILQSDILWFAFIILTGGQGLFIFIAFCVNRRTWETVKLSLRRKISAITTSTTPSENIDTRL